jgi:hypothetical protein
MNLATGNPSQALSTHTQRGGGKKGRKLYKTVVLVFSQQRKNNAMEDEWRKERGKGKNEQLERHDGTNGDLLA